MGVVREDALLSHLRLRNPQKGYVGRRTGEDACLRCFGPGGKKNPGASEGGQSSWGNIEQRRMRGKR